MGFLKKVGKTVKGAAKKFGHFTPQGQAYQIFKGAKQGGIQGAVGALNPMRLVNGDPGLFGKKDKSIESGLPEMPRSAAAKKMIRKPVKSQAGSGQIEYTTEVEE